MDKKADDQKKLYPMFSNIAYSLKMHWQTKRSTLVSCAIAVIVGVALPFTGMLLPKVVIDQLTIGSSPWQFMLSVGSLASVLIGLNYIKGYTDEIVNNAVGTIASYNAPVKLMTKIMTMDYELLESPSFVKLGETAGRAMQNNHTPAHNIPRTLVRLFVNGLGFLLYGMVIVSIHPVIILLLIFSAVINWIFLSDARRYEKNTREKRSKISSKIWHIQRVTKDPAGAKDIRLYALTVLFHDIFDSYTRQSEIEEKKVASRNMTAQIVDALLLLLRDGGAYAFLIILLLGDKITLGNFVLVFAAIGSFAGWGAGVMLQTSELLRASSEMSDIRKYFNVPDVSNTGKGEDLPKADALPPGLSLHTVSYRYPEATVHALENITITINPGERIAIVGANGAGKTTLVKLICGLYKPSKGKIRLNGTEIGLFNRDEYFTLFSTIFQDIHLLSCDIAGNISQAPPEMTDNEKVINCLKLSGLYDKVQALKDRERTLLVRRVNDDAIELSGGEKQKLALARALYKDAPVIILDEPTAALDPLAENEFYQKFNELIKNRTAIYISHRLASTRFCDRILLIENHSILESGSHDQLMALNGKYAEMFHIQAHYYQKSQVSGNEA